MHGGKREGAGRKSVRIDLEELEKLCGLQCTDEEVAAYFSVTVRTIERRRKQLAFAAAMQRGQGLGRVSVRRFLFKQAAKGNAAAAIFLAKNLLGYRDVRNNQLSGPDGGPIPLQNSLDFTRLSTEEFDQVLALIDKAERPPGETK